MGIDIKPQWFGRVSYERGLLLQKEKWQEVSSVHNICLIGLEHEPVVTLGVRSHGDQSFSGFVQDFPVVKTKRGGHATIHNPGQLVIYPVVPLRELGLGVRDFVCLLTKTSKDFFNSHGVSTFEKEEPGLFTQNGKIALIGIQVSKGVSQHGVSLNINNDLQPFKEIAVCGVQNESMDRLSNYKSDLNLETEFKKWIKIFEVHLSVILSEAKNL